MKRLSLYLFLLLFTLQAPSWADDIRDFQIEGLSVGDSLLDYYSKDEIIKNYRTTKFKKKLFILSEFNKYDSKLKFETYDRVQFYIKSNDKNYKIYQIRGLIFPIKFDECKKKQDEILSELDDLFKNEKGVNKSRIKAHVHAADPKSTLRKVYYYFSSGGQISVTCADYSTINRWPDELSISVSSKEFADFLNNKAYK